MAESNRKAPFNALVSVAGVYAPTLRERRLKRLIEAYDASGRRGEAARAREQLQTTQRNSAFTEKYFYPDLGSA